MRAILLLTGLLLSSLSFASDCEVISYEKVYYDYTMSPKELIIDSAKKYCNQEELSKIQRIISFKSMTTLEHGASSYYSVQTKGGIYQIMTSSMSEPPKAIVMYSRYD